MFRVANFAQHQLTMSYAMRTQSNWADRQIQIASGKQGQLYSSIATKASELVNVERSVGRTEQFSRNIDQALTRLGIMESAVGTMVDRATEVLSIISSAMSGENIQDVPLDTFSATFLAEIESLLNTQHEDRYLFAGSQTNTRAVDLSDAAYTPQAGLPGTFTADLDYYQGDTLQLSVRSAETFETTYGITADEPAFEELLRALSYMGYAGTNQDAAVLEQSFTMMKSAVDGLSDIRGRIGASSKVLGSAKSGHEDYLTYATNLVSTLEDVDVAVATTRLAQDEVQLQASYLALSRIGEMSLLSYLR
ncbi:MAG TPA: flagellin [Kiloniellaceae bacterium]